MTLTFYPSVMSAAVLPTTASVAQRYHVVRSLPFAVQGLAYLAVLQVGTIALGSAQLVEDAGSFSVAMNIVTAMHLLPSAVFARVFAPRYFLWGNSDPARLARTAPRVLAWVMVVSILASIAAWFCAVGGTIVAAATSPSAPIS